MFKKIRKLIGILKRFFKDEDDLFLYLLELKAYECLRDCFKLDISDTEELEDLIFHIKAYRELPESIMELKYPEFKGLLLAKDIVQRYKEKKMSLVEVSLYGDYLIELERERALERDCIFDHAKVLTFGFKL